MNRTYLFIIITSAALLSLLIIQVNWILRAAKVKEELFNEKANMVLSRTAEALSSDTTTYQKLQIFAGKNEKQKIDSLFNHYMRLYNIHIDYFFEVRSNVPPSAMGKPYTPAFLQERSGAYVACLEKGADKEGLELKLVFPKKERFIREEMGIPFFSSVILIMVVLILSWRTILSLLKEKELAEHVTDLLNNMTHEFKTPLTNIALAGKMIRKETSVRQEMKTQQYAEIILEENEKLRLQVEQVLSLTALEKGELPIQRTELDMHEMLQECIKRMQLQLESKRGKIIFRPEALHVKLMGDKDHLSNALCNLIDNAIKYSQSEPELEIRTVDNNGSLLLTISDKGIGIEKQHHEKVFDKFFRVPTGNLHNVKGFGLGLSYVKKMVELHGGTIELLSEKDKGTTFILKLPHV
jgi:two-component system phosphate regulon sensor histidine kinase PhoR